MSLTKVSYSMISGAKINVLDYGADPTGTNDSSDAITAALAAGPHTIVPPGNYRCDSMLELNANKTLELMGGTTLKRYSSGSASTDPVVWIKGSEASFFGVGQSNSYVISENRAPNGVVRIGHKDMTESHANVTYCTLRDMTIAGALSYGQTTGQPDAALAIINPQFNDLAVYFHNITGLKVQQANFGIWLRGWANANTISNIQGYLLGNTSMVASGGDAFIYIDGALDNAISNAFLHFSADTTGLKVTDNDNTGNGGVLHQPYANACNGLIFEQGGANAFGAKIAAGSGSYYEIRDNCNQGNQVFAGFDNTNVLISVNSSNYTLGVSTKNKFNIAQNNVKSSEEKYLTYSLMIENETYKIVDIPVGTGQGAMLEVDFSSSAGLGLPFMGGGKVIYQFRNNAGTLTSTAILSRYSGDVSPCVPIITGTTALIAFKVGNNGTATSATGLSVNLRLVSPTVTPVYYTTLVAAGVSGTPLANNI